MTLCPSHYHLHNERNHNPKDNPPPKSADINYCTVSTMVSEGGENRSV